MSGGSGLIGSALTRALRIDGNVVLHLVRPGSRQTSGDVRWDPNNCAIDMAAMEGTDAVVHLSGASIAESRWTSTRKAVLRSSRIDSTRVLVDAITHLKETPRVFVCASAIGYYGDRGDELLTESTANGGDFLSLLARDWEAEATRAAHAGIRTVLLRFGVVLASQGGALPKLIAPFRWGIGGPLGDGRQWISWIALEDAVDVALQAVVNERFSGPVNVVAPNPVRNVEFAQIAGRVLHRPAIFPTPAFALRLALGEMAQALLLASQRVLPECLLQAGYSFRDEALEPALRRILCK